VKRRAKDEVVNLGELVVDVFDEVVLDGGYGQGARRCVAGDILGVRFTVK